MKTISKKIGVISLLAFVLAIIAGLLVPDFCKAVSAAGTVYVNLLKMMMVPLLFASITTAASGDGAGLSRLTVRSIVLFVVMFVVSFLLCSVLWSILQPGAGSVFEMLEWNGETAALSFSEFLLAVFPGNIFKAMSENTILPVIIFAFVFGVVIRRCNLDKLRGVFAELNTALEKMLSYVMLLTPIGVFALMGNTVATYGGQILGTTALYVGCAYLGCVMIALLVMILPVWIACGIHPLQYMKKVYKVWVLAFTTCSSAATLPTTMRVCNEEFHVPERITNLVVPLGCTIHMCGGAVSFSLLAFFTMQCFGVSLQPGSFLLMLALALLLNMGAPGLPGGGIVLGATYLSVLGLPLSFIGFYAGIYRLLDMAYTTMNVCGDVTANLLICKMEMHSEEERKTA